MAIPADDDVVVHLDAEPARDLDDLPGHVDVGARRCRVASGVIVDQNDRCGAQLERALDRVKNESVEGFISRVRSG
jgi:hypothetical protein